MSKRPKLSDGKVSLLHPAMSPSESPIDFQRDLTGDQFREVFSQQSYTWIASPSGASHWSAVGTFTTKDLAPTQGNRVFTRFALLDEDDNEIGHADLSAASCVSIARHLLGFAIASANINAEHAVVADKLTDMLGEFLHPDRFASFVNSLKIAAREEISAEIEIRKGINAKRS